MKKNKNTFTTKASHFKNIEKIGLMYFNIVPKSKWQIDVDAKNIIVCKAVYNKCVFRIYKNGKKYGISKAFLNRNNSSKLYIQVDDVKNTHIKKIFDEIAYRVKF